MLTFRPCDESNLGDSGLCDLEGQTLFEPTIWGKQVHKEIFFWCALFGYIYFCYFHV